MTKFTSDIVIGLEIHVELNTDTKLFCACTTKADEPNTACCPVCLGHPGSKPVLNRKAVEYAIRIGLGLNCRIAPQLIFSRKSYFYPDLAKNYQITQYEIPLCSDGYVELDDGTRVGIERAHLEEDPASLVHSGSMQESQFVLVDYNRSGRPLCEIVTRPDLKSPEQAREFLNKLITLLTYLKVFDPNRNIIKADANISIKESGYVRSEIKNITGFKEIEKALFYEMDRQKIAAKNREKFVQDTRAWDADKGMSIRMRIKETEADYGYILDPDLVVTEITDGMVAGIMKNLPEMPHEKIRKFIDIHKIKREDAVVLASELVLAELFEKVAEKIDPVLAAKWLRRELLRVMNYNKKTFDDLVLDERHMIELLKMVESREITDETAKRILEKLMEEQFSPKEFVAKEGLGAVSDESEIRKLCEEAVKENPKAVEDYKAGSEKSLNFIIGQVMKKSKGKAVPDQVNRIVKKLIG